MEMGLETPITEHLMPRHYHIGGKFGNSVI